MLITDPVRPSEVEVSRPYAVLGKKPPYVPSLFGKR
jgi:hypothetical protein